MSYTHSSKGVGKKFGVLHLTGVQFPFNKLSCCRSVSVLSVSPEFLFVYDAGREMLCERCGQLRSQVAGWRRSGRVP